MQRSARILSVPVSPGLPENLQERYCLTHHLTEDEFTSHLLSRSLYPHARLLAPLLRLLLPGCFELDRRFVRGLAPLRSRRGITHEANDFYKQSRRERRWRHWLRLRISADRAQRAVREAW
ncbi:hypothetical protein [Actomonas aquatica]|uniref:Uncharacterized protein n=1 Tax=Actomonas aquatica TaxID=2866162 RepID=A0ABZ1C6Z5_9BACT|nr:hypothetical protein [Opitutus sp. WL0086]WRQ87183.1 hypothetical protein K1X11_020415 [Opitutus sp. WL0086]